MKVFPDCYPCLLKQAVQALHLNGIDFQTQLPVLKEVLSFLASADETLSPAEISGETNRIIRVHTGIDDPYQAMKNASHTQAMEHLEALRTQIKEGEDPLLESLKLSALGNIIDVVNVGEYDLWDEVDVAINGDLLGGGLENFLNKLPSAPFLLMLADNVGETVFDRILIESLPLPVIYSVKSGPILNDATRVDALAAGIDKVAKIVENGTRSPGTVLSQASEEFLELWDRADLVLSKGQANYETLDDQGEKVFFLMRVKCPLISREMGESIGSLVLKQGRPQS